MAHGCMNVEIGNETPIFLFWEYLFRNFGILSLQCTYVSVFGQRIYTFFAESENTSDKGVIWLRPSMLVEKRKKGMSYFFGMDISTLYSITFSNIFAFFPMYS
jgi:hypothetical protein